jgi:hypothetical protein
LRGAICIFQCCCHCLSTLIKSVNPSGYRRFLSLCCPNLPPQTPRAG